jgi:nickel/cobalt exporter
MLTQTERAKIFVTTIGIAFLACLLVVVFGLLLGHVIGIDSGSTSVGKSPFGVGISEGGGFQSGLVGWILSIQSQFARAMTSTIDTIVNDPRGIWTLVGISFLYGVFHAAGPGHGKAVMAAYGMAHERDIPKIIAMASAAALLQGIVAITLVSVLAALLHVTAARLRETAGLIETASFAAIMLVGAGLLWQKSKALAARLIPTGASDQDHTHHGHSHYEPSHRGPSPEHHHNHAHDDHDNHNDPIHDEHCGHHHAPTIPAEGGFKGAIGAVIAAGIRPCSGSILVLVFALSQSQFGVGILAALAIAVGTGLTTSGLAAAAVLAATLASRLANHIDQRRAVLFAKIFETALSAAVTMLGLALLIGLIQSPGA